MLYDHVFWRYETCTRDRVQYKSITYLSQTSLIQLYNELFNNNLVMQLNTIRNTSFKNTIL